MTAATTIANSVKTLRCMRGMSQVRLAELAGLSQTWISRLESGDVNPTLETLERVAAAFELEPADLLKDRAA